MSWYAIINPVSGNRSGVHVFETVKSICLSNDLTVVPAVCTARGDAEHLAITAYHQGYRKFIIIGGDGTANEVVNGLYSASEGNLTDTLVGQLPVGTGNDWGRTIRSPQTPEDLVRSIKSDRWIIQDLGKCSFPSSSDFSSRMFVNIAGIGYDAVVAERTNELKRMGKQGIWIYFQSLLSCLIRFRPVKLHLQLDENRSVDEPLFSMNVGICRYSGGGMKQVPFADPSDGLFDLTVIRPMNWLQIAMNLPRLYMGTILQSSHVSGHRAAWIRIETEPVVDIEVDGEHIGRTPAEFSILSPGIKVLVREQ